VKAFGSAAVGALLAIVLTGCSDDPKPTTSYEVTYEVGGTGAGPVDVTYTTDAGESVTQTVTIPWSYTGSIAYGTYKLRVVRRPDTDGNFRCTISTEPGYNEDGHSHLIGHYQYDSGPTDSVEC